MSVDNRYVLDSGGIQMKELDCVVLLHAIARDAMWSRTDDFGGDIEAGTLATIVSANSRANMTLEICRGLASALVDVESGSVRLHQRMDGQSTHA